MVAGLGPQDAHTHNCGGSTIVMKAINVNYAKVLKKALGWAPREREIWMLNIQVGTQSMLSSRAC